MTTLRLPNITGVNTADQVVQMQKYLYTMVEELNFVLSEVEKAQRGAVDRVQTVNQGINVAEDESEQGILATFNSIKSLIIKSADITNAYYDTFKKNFAGEYLAKSDFGVYQENTNAALEANAKGFETVFTNLQELKNITSEINNMLVDTSAWVRVGVLEESDQGAVYGIEVGQRTVVDDDVEIFNRYARFTAGGTYFYDPNLEDPVAYITSRKLFIRDAEITNSLRLGKYLLVLSNGIGFKYMGGD